MTAKKSPLYNSRTADKFVVRFPDGLRDKVSSFARADGRSMNAEIFHRLQEAYGLDKETGERISSDVSSETYSRGDLVYVPHHQWLDTVHSFTISECGCPAAIVDVFAIYKDGQHIHKTQNSVVVLNQLSKRFP